MKQFSRILPLTGIVTAVALLAYSTYQYAGEVHWTRVTVSLLCAQNLPNGDENSGRGLSCVALLLLCASMALLFQYISKIGETRAQQSTIQIGGIGSMVYALLTATPMHNLMVNIALVFFLVATIAIIFVLWRRKYFVLAIIGLACVLVKTGNASLYYTNTSADVWGLLQKLSFVLTTIWLAAVHLTVTHMNPLKQSELHDE